MPFISTLKRIPKKVGKDAINPNKNLLRRINGSDEVSKDGLEDMFNENKVTTHRKHLALLAGDFDIIFYKRE